MPDVNGVGFVAYYYPEDVEGTPKTGVAYQPISQHTEFNPESVSEPVVVPKSGSKDPVGGYKGTHKAKVNLKGDIGSDFITFLKSYAYNNTSIAIVLTDGTYYYTLPGSKIIGGTISAKSAADGSPSAGKYDIDLECFDVTMTQPGGSTFAAVSGDAVNWDAISITMGGSPVSWRSFEFNFKNDFDDDFDSSGNRNALRLGTRSHDFSITETSPMSISDFTTVKNATAKTVVVTMTGLTITATNMQYDSVKDPIPNSKIITREIKSEAGGVLTFA